MAPGHQLSHLLPVVCLRPTSDQSDDCCVIRKLDDGGVALGAGWRHSHSRRLIHLYKLFLCGNTAVFRF